MNSGDKFFTIVYSLNPRVIEVEVIGLEVIDGDMYVHFYNVERPRDKWFKPIEVTAQWEFKTREEAENKLKEYK